jgi:hypothetical protein
MRKTRISNLLSKTSNVLLNYKSCLEVEKRRLERVGISNNLFTVPVTGPETLQ